ncbi:MAG: NAD-dependent epimerase/dehydratase family protein [Planctomycetes bacterium]|nr:NAD-dependent epimerase/dehydratase family protein [Planctomycetota bacterium]
MNSPRGTIGSALVVGGDAPLRPALLAMLRGAGARVICWPAAGPGTGAPPTAAGLADRIRAERPDVVFDLEPCGGPLGHQQARPTGCAQAALEQTLAILDAARDVGRSLRVVQTASAAVYPLAAPVPHSEDDLWNGFPDAITAPLAVARRTALVLLRASHDQFGTRGCQLVLGNLLGPGDAGARASSDVVPALVRRMTRARDLAQPSVTLRGSGRATRDFVDVHDAAAAAVRAAERCVIPVAINVGTGRETSILELATRIASLVGYTGEIRWDERLPDGAPRRCLDTRRALEMLDHRPVRDLDAALPEVVGWWHEHTLAGGSGRQSAVTAAS